MKILQIHQEKNAIRIKTHMAPHSFPLSVYKHANLGLTSKSDHPEASENCCTSCCWRAIGHASS